MEFPKEKKRKRLVRAPDVLMPEKPERVDFDPATDLSPEAKQAVLNYVENNVARRSWYDYASMLPHLQTLALEFQPVDIPTHEIRSILEDFGKKTHPRLDLVLHFLGNLSLSGVEVSEFGREYKQKVLEDFDLRVEQTSTDPSLAQDAVQILSLGWRTFDTLFPDRNKAWEKISQGLEWRNDPEDYYLFCQLIARIKVLFPEQFDAVKPTPNELKRMKDEVRAVEVNALIKLATYASSLYVLTADEVRLDAQGKMQLIHRAQLKPTTTLPERPLT